MRLFPIPFYTNARQTLALREELLNTTAAVLDGITFSGGFWVTRFETEWAFYCQTPHALALSNGTDALRLALLALEIGPGDEVLVPANGYIATAAAVVHTGATPVFVDCTPDTWQIDPLQLERHLSSRTKAVIGVHLYGQPFDVQAVLDFTKAHNLALLEDAAQAHGAKYHSKPVGSLSDAGCFSFYPTKNLNALGEAGALTTHRADVAHRVESLRQHGLKHAYWHEEIGYNCRIDTLQAAFLSLKLRYLDSWNARRRAIAARYYEGLNHPAIRWQLPLEETESVHHLFVVTVPDRDHFTAYLISRGIEPGRHYPHAIPFQPAFDSMKPQPGHYPNAEYLAAHCVSLPMFAELSDDEVTFVIETLNAYPFRH